MASFSTPGGLNDPSPASGGSHGIGMMINLQTAISAIQSNPHIYNAVTYLICGVMFFAWGLRTLCTPLSIEQAWIGLAAIASLTPLPIYHRQSDALLLLLSIPACVILFRNGDKAGRWALILTASTIFFTGDLTWVVIIGVIHHLPLPAAPVYQQAVIDAQVFPIPLLLLSTAAFYLWMYYRWQGLPSEAPSSPHSPAAVATATATATSESAHP
jgi:hypothetical protein